MVETEPARLVGLTYAEAWTAAGGAAAEIVNAGLEAKLISIVRQLGFNPNKKVRSLDDARYLLGLAGCYEPNVAFSDHDGNRLETNLFLDRPEKPGFLERLKQKHPFGYGLARKLLVVAAVVGTVGLAGCLGNAPVKKPEQTGPAGEELHGGGPQIESARMGHGSYNNLVLVNSSDVQNVSGELFLHNKKISDVRFYESRDSSNKYDMVTQKSNESEHYVIKIKITGKSGITEIIMPIFPRNVVSNTRFSIGTGPFEERGLNDTDVIYDVGIPLHEEQYFNEFKAAVTKNGVVINNAVVLPRSTGIISGDKLPNRNATYILALDFCIKQRQGNASGCGQIVYPFVPNKLYK